MILIRGPISGLLLVRRCPCVCWGVAPLRRPLAGAGWQQMPAAATAREQQMETGMAAAAASHFDVPQPAPLRVPVNALAGH